MLVLPTTNKFSNSTDLEDIKIKQNYLDGIIPIPKRVSVNHSKAIGWEKGAVGSQIDFPVFYTWGITQLLVITNALDVKRNLDALFANNRQAAFHPALDNHNAWYC